MSEKELNDSASSISAENVNTTSVVTLTEWRCPKELTVVQLRMRTVGSLDSYYVHVVEAPVHPDNSTVVRADVSELFEDRGSAISRMCEVISNLMYKWWLAEDAD